MAGFLAKALTGLIVLYALACLASLVLALVGTQSLAGVEPDGLAAVWAIVLALPWSLIGLALLPDEVPALVSALVLVTAMVINLGILTLIRLGLRRAAVSAR